MQNFCILYEVNEHQDSSWWCKAKDIKEALLLFVRNGFEVFQIIEVNSFTFGWDYKLMQDNEFQVEMVTYEFKNDEDDTVELNT